MEILPRYNDSVRFTSICGLPFACQRKKGLRRIFQNFPYVFYYFVPATFYTKLLCVINFMALSGYNKYAFLAMIVIISSIYV